MTNSSSASSITPAIFFGHGSPMNAIEENVFTKKWRSVGEEIRKLKVEQKPKAILSISAHFQT